MRYVFAVPSVHPDLEFPTMAALARHILAQRDTLAPDRDIRLSPAMLGRDALPDAVAVSVRLIPAVGATAGHLLGYAFCPIPSGPTDHAYAPDVQARLMAALLAGSGPVSWTPGSVAELKAAA